MVRPNGVLGTPDGKHLYVADAGGNKTYKYRINPDGTRRIKNCLPNKGRMA
jgi:gluconolactonase